MSYLYLIGGLAMLIFFGDILVRGAVALATRFAIPTLVTGLTIVAFGTSAPELVVSLKAALSDAPGIAIGNVVGSNIANILLVLGVPALIHATNCCQPMIRRNMMYVIGATLLFITLCFMGPLTFWHGAILFSLMIVFLLDSGHRAMSSEKIAASYSDEAKEILDGHCNLPNQPLRITFFLVIGLIGLPVAAYFTVNGATQIARDFGVSEAIIGLTIVAIGTSLPELATTIMAAFRKSCGLALGNVLGSNLFNILAIMGITSMVTPVPVPKEFLTIDLWIMLAAVLALTPFVFRSSRITAAAGIAFIVSYAIYIFACFGLDLDKAKQSGSSSKASMVMPQFTPTK